MRESSAHGLLISPNLRTNKKVRMYLMTEEVGWGQGVQAAAIATVCRLSAGHGDTLETPLSSECGKAAQGHPINWQTTTLTKITGAGGRFLWPEVIKF